MCLFANKICIFLFVYKTSSAFVHLCANFSYALKFSVKTHRLHYFIPNFALRESKVAVTEV